MVDFGPIPGHAWIYPARILRVVDGDTIDVEVDGGFHNTQAERLRLWGINTPEVVGATAAAGKAATAFVRAWVQPYLDLGLRWPFRVRTIKGTDAFGRYLCVVYATENGRCLNAEILAAGHAREDVR